MLKDVIDEIADALGDTSLVVPSNPVGLDAQGKVARLLPEGQSSGEVVAGWLPAGTRYAVAFGTMSADLFESSSHRSPEPAVLSYVSEDAHGSDEVERLIRTAGFEPMRIGQPQTGGQVLAIRPAVSASLSTSWMLARWMASGRNGGWACS